MRQRRDRRELVRRRLHGGRLGRAVVARVGVARCVQRGGVHEWPCAVVGRRELRLEAEVAARAGQQFADGAVHRAGRERAVGGRYEGEALGQHVDRLRALARERAEVAHGEHVVHVRAGCERAVGAGLGDRQVGGDRVALGRGLVVGGVVHHHVLAAAQELGLAHRHHGLVEHRARFRARRQAQRLHAERDGRDLVLGEPGEGAHHAAGGRAHGGLRARAAPVHRQVAGVGEGGRGGAVGRVRDREGIGHHDVRAIRRARILHRDRVGGLGAERDGVRAVRHRHQHVQLGLGQLDLGLGLVVGKVGLVRGGTDLHLVVQHPPGRPRGGGPQAVGDFVLPAVRQQHARARGAPAAVERAVAAHRIAGAAAGGRGRADQHGARGQRVLQPDVLGRRRAVVLRAHRIGDGFAGDGARRGRDRLGGDEVHARRDLALHRRGVVAQHRVHHVGGERGGGVAALRGGGHRGPHGHGHRGARAARQHAELAQQRGRGGVGRARGRAGARGGVHRHDTRRAAARYQAAQRVAQAHVGGGIRALVGHHHGVGEHVAGRHRSLVEGLGHAHVGGHFAARRLVGGAHADALAVDAMGGVVEPRVLPRAAAGGAEVHAGVVGGGARGGAHGIHHDVRRIVVHRQARDALAAEGARADERQCTAGPARAGGRVQPRERHARRHGIAHRHGRDLRRRARGRGHGQRPQVAHAQPVLVGLADGNGHALPVLVVGRGLGDLQVGHVGGRDEHVGRGVVVGVRVRAARHRHGRAVGQRARLQHLRPHGDRGQVGVAGSRRRGQVAGDLLACRGAGPARAGGGHEGQPRAQRIDHAHGHAVERHAAVEPGREGVGHLVTDAVGGAAVHRLGDGHVRTRAGDVDLGRIGVVRRLAVGHLRGAVLVALHGERRGDGAGHVGRGLHAQLGRHGAGRERSGARAGHHRGRIGCTRRDQRRGVRRRGRATPAVGAARARHRDAGGHAESHLHASVGRDVRRPLVAHVHEVGVWLPGRDRVARGRERIGRHRERQVRGLGGGDAAVQRIVAGVGIGLVARHARTVDPVGGHGGQHQREVHGLGGVHRQGAQVALHGLVRGRDRGAGRDGGQAGRTGRAGGDGLEHGPQGQRVRQLHAGGGAAGVVVHLDHVVEGAAGRAGRGRGHGILVDEHVRGLVLGLGRASSEGQRGSDDAEVEAARGSGGPGEHGAVGAGRRRSACPPWRRMIHAGLPECDGLDPATPRHHCSTARCVGSGERHGARIWQNLWDGSPRLWYSTIVDNPCSAVRSPPQHAGSARCAAAPSLRPPCIPQPTIP